MNGKSNRRKIATVNSTETVYKGKSFSFVVEDIMLPNHVRAQMAMVRHPGSTGIVPLFDDGSVVMTLQYRHAVKDYLLEIPAGTMDHGETPLQCARRELEEETGLVAKHFTKLCEVHILPAYSDEKIHVYLARNFIQTQQNLDADEILQVVKYPLEEVAAMISKGLITDALTILSIQRTWLYLQHRDMF
jgi:ADP-ribose pyrophosphatase